MYGYGYRYPIRRSGGGGCTYKNPLQIFDSNLKQWIDFSQDVTLSGSDIVSVADQSGNGADIEQTTPANRPTLTGSLNGHTTAVFNGSTDFLESSLGRSYWTFLHDINSTAKVYIVAKVGTSSNPDDVYSLISTGGESSARRGVALYYDDRSAFSYNNRLTSVISRSVSGHACAFDAGIDDEVTPNEYAVFGCEFDAGNGTAADRIKKSFNGTDLSQNNVLTNAQTGGIPSYTLHYGILPETSGAHLEGEIADVIIVDTTPTAQQESDMANYFMCKWGITI